MMKQQPSILVTISLLGHVVLSVIGLEAKGQIELPNLEPSHVSKQSRVPKTSRPHPAGSASSAGATERQERRCLWASQES